MAVDIILEIDGIKGESVIDGHADQVDVLAWSWGAHNQGAAHVSTGAGAGKVNVQDMSITKYIDKASSDIWLAVCNGKHITKLTLYVRKAGEKPLEYIKIVMNDALFTSYSTGGAGGEERVTESITLNFASFTFEYKTQDKTGKEGKGGNMGWDIAKNVKL